MHSPRIVQETRVVGGSILSLFFTFPHMKHDCLLNFSEAHLECSMVSVPTLYIQNGKCQVALWRHIKHFGKVVKYIFSSKATKPQEIPTSPPALPNLPSPQTSFLHSGLGYCLCMPYPLITQTFTLIPVVLKLIHLNYSINTTLLSLPLFSPHSPNISVSFL